MGKLRLVLSDWDRETQSWRLPKLPGLSIESLLTGVTHVSSEDWEVHSSAGEAALRWKSDAHPPKDPVVIASFQESSLLTKLTDPTFLTPTLLFLGTVITGLVAYSNGFMSSRTNLELVKLQSQMSSLAAEAKALKCDNQGDGAVAVSACLNTLRTSQESNVRLKAQLDQKTKDFQELQINYNRLKVAWQNYKPLPKP